MARATRQKAMSPRARRRAAARERAKARQARRRKLSRLVPRPLRSGWFFFAVIVAVAGVLAWNAWQRVRVVPTPREPAPLKGSALTSYSVAYKLTDTATKGKAVESTELVWVRRPYASRLETREGPPPGGQVLSGSVTNRDWFWNLRAGGEVHFGIRRQPGTAHRDISYELLRAAVDEGLAKQRGRDRVLGRECVVYSFKEPRPQAFEPPEDKERVDACVTDDGILLRDVWRLDGRVVMRRDAVQLEVGAPIPDEVFRIGEEPDPNSETNRVISQSQVVTENADPESDVVPVRTPDGYKPDRTAMHFESGGGQAPARNTYIQSFVRGSELVIVDQGEYRAERPPWSSDEGLTINLSRHWSSRLLWYPDRVEIRFWRMIEQDGLPATRFARVQAPSRDIAVWIAKQML